MSSSVRSRISEPANLLEDQVDEVVTDEEQGCRTRDEGETDDRDRRTRQNLRYLTLARAADKDHAEDRQQDRCDLAGEKGDDVFGGDALGLWLRRRYQREHVCRVRGSAPRRCDELCG